MFDLGRSYGLSVERSPNATAIVDGERRWTYGEWLDPILRAAAGLERLGLVKGDHLITVMQNRWEAATLYWACQYLGVIITPLNWRLKAGELDYCISDAFNNVVCTWSTRCNINFPCFRNNNRNRIVVCVRIGNNNNITTNYASGRSSQWLNIGK